MNSLDADGLIPVEWACAACGEVNETLFDTSGGVDQQFTEDCAVCCRPNLLRLYYDLATGAVGVTNELEQW